MGFQNTINNMLGAAGAAVALGKHIKNQEEQLANQEAQKGLQAKEFANEARKNAEEQKKIENKIVQDINENENLTDEEKKSFRTEDGSLDYDKYLESEGKKAAEMTSSTDSIERQKGHEALRRLQDLRDARNEFKFQKETALEKQRLVMSYFKRKGIK